MKRISLLFAAAIAALSVASCDFPNGEVVSNKGTVSLDFGEAAAAAADEPVKVVLTNVGTAQAYEFEARAGETLDFSGVVPGVYDIVASSQYSRNGIIYNCLGTLKNVTFKPFVESRLNVQMNVTKSSPLIFKEVHYNANKYINPVTGKSASYLKDTFFEVYNNGEQTVYLDGVCIGDPLGINSFNFAHQADKLKHPVSEYIWIGTYVWQIPGNGSEYPLAPGESAVIAASAGDHGLVGEGLIDLSQAEFECICQKYIDKGQVDEAAPNMKLACTIKETGLANQFGNFTGTAWVLFYPSEGLRKDGEYLESDKANNYGQEILISDVFDAIDCVKNATTDKKLPDVLDAGKIFCATTGNNQSIVRKVASTLEDGRKVYQDTNNTTEDFEVVTPPAIRRDGAKRPSWATWGR
ncbi:MAG: DUF4876 domain-containing protein [Bacteroidales bacterium]|nr:DUF4876 domain-containing protein [Bacteroidales bacterium]